MHFLLVVTRFDRYANEESVFHHEAGYDVRRHVFPVFLDIYLPSSLIYQAVTMDWC